MTTTAGVPRPGEGDPWTVSSAHVGELVQLIFDPAREVPLVVLSIASDTGKPRLSPEDVCRVVGRRARVVVFDSMATSEALSNMVSAAFATYGGAVRVIAPKASGSDHYRRHPLVNVYPGDDPAERLNWVGMVVTRVEASAAAAAKRQGVVVGAVPVPVRSGGAPTPAAVFGSLRGAAPAAVEQTAAVERTAAVEQTDAVVRAPVVAAGEPVASDAPSSASPAGATVGEWGRDEARKWFEATLLDSLALLGEGGSQSDAVRERSRADMAEQEVDELRARLAADQERISELEQQLQMAAAATGGALPTVYRDAEQQLRWEVQTIWLLRHGESSGTQLAAEWTISAGFIESLGQQIVPRAKTIEVMVDVLTGEAHSRRKMHQFTEKGNGSKQRTRSDRAVGWRVFVKSDSPGAPRLTYWQLTDGTVEFDHVGHHDDAL